MHYKKFLPIVLALFLIISACKKTKTPIPNTNNADVYIVGYSTIGAGSHAVYWKNGIETDLQNNLISQAYSIAVQGNDVYVAGVVTSGNNFVASYWKNGVLNILGDQTKNSFANSIAVQGNDIYVVGFVTINNVNTAALWKNGVLTMLSDTFSEANAVAVESDNVYIEIAGAQPLTDAPVPMLWKNGVIDTLPTSTIKGAMPTSLHVQGNDVYISGISGDSKAIYWKNGQEIMPTNVNPSEGFCIAVDGNDVYLAGVVSPGPNFVATYWKNGTEVNITDGSQSALIYGIKANQGNVYAAGIVGNYATCWENGKSIKLSDSPGVALGIVVIPK